MTRVGNMCAVLRRRLCRPEAEIEFDHVHELAAAAISIEAKAQTCHVCLTRSSMDTTKDSVQTTAVFADLF